MIVALIRHGAYEASGNDEDPLSEQGKSQILRLSQSLLEKNIRPKRIFSSPLLRAIDSAKILAESFSKKVEIFDPLKNFDPSKILEKIREHQGENLFFVGHAPSLLEFSQQLNKKPFLVKKLEKGSAIILEFSENIDFQKANFLEYISS